MTNVLFAKQRAERFAQLLDEAEGRPRRHVRTNVDDQLTELVAVGKQAGGLAKATAGVRAGDEFKIGLRAMLMATAERDGIGVTAVPEAAPARPTKAPARVFGLRGRTRAAVLIGLAAGTITLSSMSAASDDAVPGDPLYGIKRSTEQAQLALAGTDLSRGQLYLAFAKKRAREAKAVADDQGALKSLLDDMDDETRLGVRTLTGLAVGRNDSAPLTAITKFVAGQRKDLAAVLAQVPAESRARVADSLKLLEDANTRALDLQNSLRCGTPATNGVDRLGPQPGTCVAKGGTATQPESGNNGSGTGTTTGGQSTGTQTGSAPSPGANAAPSGGASTPTADPSPSTPTEEDDSGLLDQLGRLLGGLLGG